MHFFYAGLNCYSCSSTPLLIDDDCLSGSSNVPNITCQPNLKVCVTVKTQSPETLSRTCWANDTVDDGLLGEWKFCDFDLCNNNHGKTFFFSFNVNEYDFSDPKLKDHHVVDELTKLWGIGRWTAEMFLMFTLYRLDVWPTGDLAMRRGWEQIHGLTEHIDPKQLDSLGNAFSPYRSVVAWYCWRIIDGDSQTW